MKSAKYKSKNFLLPILLLVLTSIISIALINTYITMNMFNTHMKNHIEKTKNIYTQEHKEKVFKEVNFVKDTIEFEITKIEEKVKISLKERVENALSIATYTYNTFKNTHTKEEIKVKISEILSEIKINDNRGYYFMYDNKTKVLFGHPQKKFIGKDMSTFKDASGQNLMKLDEMALEKNEIAYNKIHFNKPTNETKEFPKITCITRFKPLDLVLGSGEYLDIIKKQTQEHILKRFSQNDYKDKDNYISILDVHNLKGGDNFATVLLNSNRLELIGSKVSTNTKDIKGNKFRKDFLDLVVSKGEGYSKYWYKKPSTDSPALKISYFYLQKDWNWIISSGFYYEDLETQIAIMEELLHVQTSSIIDKTLSLVLILSLIAIIIAAFVSLRIDNTIKEYTNTIIEYEDNKRKHENLLIQQSKMAAMGEMLANIAHQWRQPLSTISTSATGAKLQKEMDCLSDSQLYDTFTTINNSAQYLSKTIDDFRDFFNPTNNKMSEFKISELFNKTLNIISSQFNTKDIEIIKNIDELTLLSIENELIQVLINILNNAKDALEKVESKRRLIFINVYKNNDEINIEIKDNANGIATDIIDRIFEPYFTTKHKSQGTGIGLYMSEEIVKNHLNGMLTVSNESYIYENINYVGAKFTIKFTTKI